jgi:predicted DNA-binding transcriptional regulator AlpA
MLAMSFKQSNPSFDSLPDSAFVRESQLVRNPRHPPSQALLPISGSTLWRSVKKNEFPAPVRLTEGVVAWRVGDVRNYLKKIEKKSCGGVA